MKVIWKYELNVTSNAEIEMPAGAKILTVQVQDGIPCIWALVEPIDCVHEVRKFYTYGTGHQYDEIPGSYIGTYQLHGGKLIFHVFSDALLHAIKGD